MSRWTSKSEAPRLTYPRAASPKSRSSQDSIADIDIGSVRSEQRSVSVLCVGDILSDRGCSDQLLLRLGVLRFGQNLPTGSNNVTSR